MSRPVVKSAERTLQVLESLAGSRTGMAFNELQRTLRIPKSSLHGLLQTLCDRGWVETDDTGARYSLGLRSLQLAGAYQQNDNSIRSSRARMQQLSNTTGETVQLARLDGGDVVYLAQMPSVHPISLVSAVGQRLPAHATALGKAILATLTDEEVLDRCAEPLVRLTANTHATPDSLLADLRKIRTRGYAIDAEESSPGLLCFAVALWFDESRTPVAISISVPAFRLTDGMRASIVRLLSAERRLPPG